MRRLFTIGALAAALLAVGTGEAFAQFQTFMLVPGIPGSSTVDNRTDWIEVQSLSQGVAVARKSASCQDLNVSKNLDQTGPALWFATASRQLFPEIRIEIVRAGDGPGAGQVIYDIRLSNARATSAQTGSGGDLPTESISFSFDSVTLTFNAQDANGKIIPGTPQTITCQ